MKPDYVDARYNLGVLLFESRRYSIAAEQFGLVGTHQSKRYGLRCLYLQDEETVFLDQLNALIGQGDRDAVIGSLSCCAETRYGVINPNPFCNKPLMYDVKTDLNQRYDFENNFAKTARDILTDKSVSDKAQGHLNNGIQTAGNLFAMKKVVITEIESIIDVVTGSLCFFPSQLRHYTVPFEEENRIVLAFDVVPK